MGLQQQLLLHLWLWLLIPDALERKKRSTTSVLPTQLDLRCTKGWLQGLHNPPHHAGVGAHV